MSDNPDSTSFNKNYKVLKDTADWLSQQKEPDIDQLVPKVESAMAAYKICKTRLDAVQATLSQYFEPEGTAAADDAPSKNGEGKSRLPRPATPPSDTTGEDEDDIPF